VTRRWIELIGASAVVLAAAAIAQTPTPAAPRTSPTPSSSREQGSGPTPTNPVPDAVMTPGASALTPGAGSVPSNRTPGYGGNIFGLPPTTPSGMPSYTLSPGPSGTAATPTGRPRTPDDCANGKWRTYGLGFTDERNCREWARTHPSGSSEMGAPAGETPASAAGTPPPSSRTPPPRRTPHARRMAPTPAATPRLSSKPPATRIPFLRAGSEAQRDSAAAASVRSATSAS
jgi:hypothetical protein